MEIQAIRFRADHWTTDAAKAWLKNNNFQPLSFKKATDPMFKSLWKNNRQLVKSDSAGLVKEFAFQADSVSEAGEFVGYAAVYNTRDLAGDTIAPGAFDDVLASMTQAAKFPPVVWDHDADNPIGQQVLSSDDKGLKVQGKLWIDPVMGLENARKAYLLMKNTTYYMSFWSEDWWFVRGADGGRMITRVDSIQETSITSHPCNVAAEVLKVASDQAAALAFGTAAEFVANWLQGLSK